MPIKIISIIVLAILTMVSQNNLLADSKYSSRLFIHSQSIFCAETTAETTEEENKDKKEEAQEEEEPDCD